MLNLAAHEMVKKKTNEYDIKSAYFLTFYVFVFVHAQSYAVIYT